ncbi:MAG: formyltransferase family protein [Candidatus Saccharibacteria bacterium]|nr:formyltransferase family protein [Candidatus Saccharibacteria bacterium]
MNRIIFFGNGPLAEAALRVLKQHFEVVFHAHTKEDLMQACEIKRKTPEAHGVLASFGVLIKADVLGLFEPEGILNIHPSLLPKYRGPSPIESAILDGNNDFSVSVMKLVKAMDAGPIYWQATLSGSEIAAKTGTRLVSGLIPSKAAIYQALAETGAKWICKNLADLKEPTSQDESNATFCSKFDKSMSFLKPGTNTAELILRKIIAFQGFPKAKYAFYGKNCAILAAHILQPDETAILPLTCANGQILSIDKLQPDGKKPMDAKSFINGYTKR